MKITQEQVKKGNKAMQALVEKAWESATFKEQLITKPVETMNTFFGKEATVTTKVVVEDQMDTSIIYLNIPAKPNLDKLELTEEQLDMISGGNWNPIVALGAGAHHAWNGFVDACDYIGSLYTIDR